MTPYDDDLRTGDFPMARPAPPAGPPPPPRWKDPFFIVSLAWLVLAVAGGCWWVGTLIRSWLGF